MEWLKPCFSSLIRSGPVPKHVAFIMDGNRRFAERDAAGDLRQGHSKGFDKLLEALEWCLELGMQCVTVYAFSIENYNRTRQEVDTLMDLAAARLRQFFKEGEVTRKHDLRVCIIGNLSLLPEHVQRAAEEVCEATASNHGPILNVCLSYLSSQEMAQALRKQDAPGSTRDFNASLYTKDCPPVDLLIRTSGESRLSDFMLWQSQHALLHFSDVLWPDFSFWHLLKAIVSYQTAYRTQQTLKAGAAAQQLTPAQRAGANNVEHIDQQACKGEDSRSFAASGSAQRTADQSRAAPSRHDATEGRLPRQGQATDLAESSVDLCSAAPNPSIASTQTVGDTQQPGIREASGTETALPAPSRRKAKLGGDRIDRSKKHQFLETTSSEAGLFFKPEDQAEERRAQLRRNGFAGGYDSMEDSDEDSAHVNGCPCCIVKYLPMHRICTDPTPAIKAIRDS